MLYIYLIVYLLSLISGCGNTSLLTYLSYFCIIDKSISRYVGVDIAVESLKQFVNERLLTLKDKRRDYRGGGGGNGSGGGGMQKMKVTHLIEADLGVDSLISSQLETHTWNVINLNPNTSEITSNWEKKVPLTTDDLFDIVSCQFAMHYMFQSEIKANHFFAEISRHLRENGVFIATTIDSRALADLAAEQLCGEYEIPPQVIPSTHRPTVSTSENHSMESIESKSHHYHSDTNVTKVVMEKNESKTSDSNIIGNSNGNRIRKRTFEEIEDDVETNSKTVVIDDSNHHRKIARTTVGEEVEKVVLVVKNQLDSELLRISLDQNTLEQLLPLPSLSSSSSSSSSSSTLPLSSSVPIPSTSSTPPSTSFPSSSSSSSSYGMKYTFELRDKPDEAAVNAPEWLVMLYLCYCFICMRVL